MTQAARRAEHSVLVWTAAHLARMETIEPPDVRRETALPGIRVQTRLRTVIRFSVEVMADSRSDLAA
jgi:hypothetical protein